MAHPDHQAPKETKDTLARLVSLDYLVKEDNLVCPEKRESVVLLDQSALRDPQGNKENVAYRESWAPLVLQVSPQKEEILDHLVPPVNLGLLV